MSQSETTYLQEVADSDYKYGFVTDIEADTAPVGLNEDTVRLISSKKGEPEWMLQWRLRALRHFRTLQEREAYPRWAHLRYPEIDFNAISYYSAPNNKPRYNSLDEVDPKLLETFERLGVPIEERKLLAGVAVDVVMDSVSVATTFKEELAKKGIIFCSFGEAVENHPDLVQRYIGSVVPYTDNFYAALNSAVVSDGSCCYIPPGGRCPRELSAYFRSNQAGTGQGERTRIIAD
jgi:Fe-S cluster assembly protein SufB